MADSIDLVALGLEDQRRIQQLEGQIERRNAGQERNLQRRNAAQE